MTVLEYHLFDRLLLPHSTGCNPTVEEWGKKVDKSIFKTPLESNGSIANVKALCYWIKLYGFLLLFKLQRLLGK